MDRVLGPGASASRRHNAKEHGERSEEDSDEMSPVLGEQGIPARVSRMVGGDRRLSGLSAHEVRPLLSPFHGALGSHDWPARCAPSLACHAAQSGSHCHGSGG